MDTATLQRISAYVNDNIDIFHAARLEKLTKLKLAYVLQRKNPYLFRAKNILTGSELIDSLLRAFLSSSEEEMFGQFLEGLAIYVAELSFGGRKSAATGVDLEMERGGVRYLVAIKSGPNWGNSSQYSALKRAMQSAVVVVKQDRRVRSVQPILGLCYGRKRSTDNGLYIVLCGQHFWELVSGEPSFYIDLVKPLGYRAKQHNDAFDEARAALHNRLTGEFIGDFCDAQGNIDWDKLVRFNSEQLKPYPL